MFTPFTLRGLTLREPRRRLADGAVFVRRRHAGRYHLVHLGSRAHGGAGLVFTEMTCVSPDARITPGLRRALYTTSSATRGGASSITCIRAAREDRACSSVTPGRRARRSSAGKTPTSRCRAGNWPLIAPSAIPYGPRNQVPRAMTRDDMDRVKADFVARDTLGAPSAASTGWSCTARTAICCRRSSVRSPTVATTNTAARSRTAAGIRSRCSRRCAPCGRRTSRCRCASRRTTGRRAATRRTTPSRSRGCSRRRART